MIRSLRKRHWWTFLILAVGLPILFAVAVLSRQDPPLRTPALSSIEETLNE